MTLIRLLMCVNELEKYQITFIIHSRQICAAVCEQLERCVMWNSHSRHQSSSHHTVNGEVISFSGETHKTQLLLAVPPLVENFFLKIDFFALFVGIKLLELRCNCLWVYYTYDCCRHLKEEQRIAISGIEIWYDGLDKNGHTQHKKIKKYFWVFLAQTAAASRYQRRKIKFHLSLSLFGSFLFLLYVFC